LGDAQVGQIIELEFTCPEAVGTLPLYCQEHNHEILSFDKLSIPLILPQLWVFHKRRRIFS